MFLLVAALETGLQQHALQIEQVGVRVLQLLRLCPELVPWRYPGSSSRFLDVVRYELWSETSTRNNLENPRD